MQINWNRIRNRPRSHNVSVQNSKSNNSELNNGYKKGKEQKSLENKIF